MMQSNCVFPVPDSETETYIDSYSDEMYKGSTVDLFR